MPPMGSGTRALQCSRGRQRVRCRLEEDALQATGRLGASLRGGRRGGLGRVLVTVLGRQRADAAVDGESQLLHRRHGAHQFSLTFSIMGGLAALLCPFLLTEADLQALQDWDAACSGGVLYPITHAEESETVNYAVLSNRYKADEHQQVKVQAAVQSDCANPPFRRPRVTAIPPRPKVAGNRSRTPLALELRFTVQTAGFCGPLCPSESEGACVDWCRRGLFATMMVAPPKNYLAAPTVLENKDGQLRRHLKIEWNHTVAGSGLATFDVRMLLDAGEGGSSSFSAGFDYLTWRYGGKLVFGTGPGGGACSDPAFPDDCVFFIGRSHSTKHWVDCAATQRPCGDGCACRYEACAQASEYDPGIVASLPAGDPFGCDDALGLEFAGRREPPKLGESFEALRDTAPLEILWHREFACFDPFECLLPTSQYQIDNEGPMPPCQTVYSEKSIVSDSVAAWIPLNNDPAPPPPPPKPKEVPMAGPDVTACFWLNVLQGVQWHERHGSAGVGRILRLDMDSGAEDAIEFVYFNGTAQVLLGKPDSSMRRLVVPFMGTTNPVHICITVYGSGALGLFVDGNPAGYCHEQCAVGPVHSGETQLSPSIRAAPSFRRVRVTIGPGAEPPPDPSRPLAYLAALHLVGGTASTETEVKAHMLQKQQQDPEPFVRVTASSMTDMVSACHALGSRLPAKLDSPQANAEALLACEDGELGDSLLRCFFGLTYDDGWRWHGDSELADLDAYNNWFVSDSLGEGGSGFFGIILNDQPGGSLVDGVYQQNATFMWRMNMPMADSVLGTWSDDYPPTEAAPTGYRPREVPFGQADGIIDTMLCGRKPRGTWAPAPGMTRFSRTTGGTCADVHMCTPEGSALPPPPPTPPPPPPSSSTAAGASPGAMAAAVLGALLMAIGAAILVARRRRRGRSSSVPPAAAAGAAQLRRAMHILSERFSASAVAAAHTKAQASILTPAALELLGPIGQGAHGRVLRARLRGSGDDLALKLPRIGAGVHPDTVVAEAEALLAEALLLSLCAGHRAILQVNGILLGAEPGQMGFCTPLMPNGDLKRFLQSCRPLIRLLYRSFAHSCVNLL